MNSHTAHFVPPLTEPRAYQLFDKLIQADYSR